jgi:hypothetical protein
MYRYSIFNPEDKLSESRKEKQEEEERRQQQLKAKVEEEEYKYATPDDLKRIQVLIKFQESQLQELASIQLSKENEINKLTEKFEKIKMYLIGKKNKEINNLECVSL